MTSGVYPRPSLESRFWAKVDKSGDCWLWTGAKTGQGYGAFTYMDAVRQHTVGAHRVAYELVVGPIPDGLGLLHSCDNPPCVNPAHLTPGTQAENIQDAVRKGHWSRDPERSPFARLTWTEVAEIRARADEGHGRLAAAFGVSRPTISRVLAYQTWKAAA